MHDPAPEYRERLESRRAQASACRRRELGLSRARLIVFALGAAAAWGILASPRTSSAWLAVPIAAFGAAVLRHDAARRASLRAERAVRFYERGLERLEHRFAGRGKPGLEFADPVHPYADQLDLFGPGSMYELLCSAETRAGEETLARWLLEPAAPDEIRARQHALEELRPRLDLREELALVGPDVRAGVDSPALVAWGNAGRVFEARALALVAPALVGLSALGAALLYLRGVGWVLLVSLVVQGGFGLALRRRAARAVGGIDRAERELALLGALLACFERQRFEAPKLVALRAALDTAGRPPSAEIAWLRRLVELLDSRRNQLFAPLAPFLLWTTQCALAIDRWRSRCGPRLAHWIGALGELEALCDLAAYAYEHPRDPFPELVDEGALFEAEALGHALIPDERCVRNDVVLGAPLRLFIVSGSNMSGKSTLLRSVGTNVVLAQAGAPVRARRLRLSPLSLGACLRVQDSLQGGTSRFFAEIRRLRGIADLARGPRPLLFLLDEILQGTNSSDRAAGAAALLQRLVELGALGLVTTHDLALARIADSLDGTAANVHFEDSLENGALRFDYRLRPGVVQGSNALALMRSIGLEV